VKIHVQENNPQQHTNHGRDTQPVQETAEQNTRHVQDKPLVGVLPKIPHPTPIARFLGNAEQTNQVRDNPQRTRIHREMGRTNTTSLTSLRRFLQHATIFDGLEIAP
jgi:hypothetical protein